MEEIKNGEYYERIANEYFEALGFTCKYVEIPKPVYDDEDDEDDEDSKALTITSNLDITIPGHRFQTMVVIEDRYAGNEEKYRALLQRYKDWIVKEMAYYPFTEIDEGRRG